MLARISPAEEMRTLLELHYDDVHLAKWKQGRHKDRKAPGRNGPHKVLNSVALADRRGLCTRLEFETVA